MVKKKGIIQDEEKEDALRVDYGVCVDYFSFCARTLGGKWSVLLVLGLHILINIATSSMSFYLAFALSDFGDNRVEGSASSAPSSAPKGTESITESQEGLAKGLGVIIIVCLVVTVLGKYVSSLIFMSINRNIHTKVVDSLINTKMQFFDENPSGRIINRLSKDIQVSDMIVFNFLEMIDYIIKCLFSVTFIVSASPWTLIVVFVQLWYFRRLRRKVIITTRDCYSLNQMLNAPLISLV